MNKYLLLCVTLLSAHAYAATGEYWEVTNKMEMPGMPFSMPATTNKVCIGKGQENDPGKSAGDKNCKMTDVKTSGNKTTWKVTCDHNGEIMTGSGEQTSSASGYEGKMQFSGKSHGRDNNMSMVYSGKRIGGSCDPEEQKRAITAQSNAVQADINKAMAKQCDLSSTNSTERILNKLTFLNPQSPCGNKKKEFCNLVRSDVANSIEAYDALVADEDNLERSRDQMSSMKMSADDMSIVKGCNLNISASLKALCTKINVDNRRQFSKHCPAEAKALCKKINGKNYDKLSGDCPAEAKIFREAHRKEYCEGRSYTAETRSEDIKRCISGQTDDDSNSNDSANESGNGNTTTDMLNGAKKLKGLFGL